MAARRDADRHHGFEPLRDLAHAGEHLRHALERHLDLDDGGEDLLAEDVRADGPLRGVGHERRHRVHGLEVDPERRERPRHPLDVAEAGAHAGAAELDDEARLALLHAARDVVRLHLGRAAAVDAGRLMGHLRVGEGAPHDAGPGELLGREGVGGADVRLGIEAEAGPLRHAPDGADEGGVQVLLRHPAVAGEALDAGVLVHDGAVQRRRDGDGAHGTHGHAVRAAHALLRIDPHVQPPAPPPGARTRNPVVPGVSTSSGEAGEGPALPSPRRR